MNKKVLSLVLACMVLLSAALPVCADEQVPAQEKVFTITNPDSFAKLVENCRLDSYSRDLVVNLRTDLDLTGMDFSGIPIFCGRFEGNGHTIRGLDLTVEGSDQGFFRYLTETAVVSDLHLEGVVQGEGTGSRIGGFVGENNGILRGCSFTGTVSGKEYIGGMAGENMVTGTIENCRVSGSVFGGHFVGGIAGKNAGTIRGCENHAPINETSWKNEIELTDISLDSVIHSEAANTVTDIGGIAGHSIGMIRDCGNHANVGYPSMGYNIGGIAGTQSGSILNCENHGKIFGRKEIGGIAGQMEPSAVMKFEEDALQILMRQLDGLGKAVSQAGSNLQGAGTRIINQMNGMMDYVWDAEDAVASLVPDLENLEFPDWDAIQAAKNNIGSSLSGMSQLMEGVGATAYSALGKVSSNLHAINDQINSMRATIGNISETTGGSLIDRSDEDTELDLSGKVAQCKNFGDVQGDLNCGGITGAMAMENDLDVEEDWLISGNNSLNFESELRAVILDCENRGKVTVGKQNAGGIVGLQSLGLVKNSCNAGNLDAENADYVGGVSGRSLGFIRGSYANGEVFGKNYVGGLAGAAAVATDCSVLVRIGSGVEKVGAVLGSREENRAEVEDPISRNHYLPVQKDPGAIDGISYEGLAQPMREEEFFLQEHLPEVFRHVTVTFRYGNGMERAFTVDFGGAFPEAWIPPIPPKDGRESYWKGLEDADLTGIFFDMAFEQAYTNQTAVLESELTREDVPLLFVQGVFSEDASLTVTASEEQIPLEANETPLEVWEFRTTEPANQTQIRLQLPEEVDADAVRILLRSADGSWRKAEHHMLGRYGVTELVPGEDAIAVVQVKDTPWLLIGGGIAAVAVLAAVLLGRKRKKKTQ